MLRGTKIITSLGELQVREELYSIVDLNDLFQIF